MCVLSCFVVFFFQAEDGIRDLVRSRGLGDVYKRQANSTPFIATVNGEELTYRFSEIVYDDENEPAITTVSYTHLTLPTIYSV